MCDQCDAREEQERKMIAAAEACSHANCRIAEDGAICPDCYTEWFDNVDGMGDIHATPYRMLAGIVRQEMEEM